MMIDIHAHALPQLTLDAALGAAKSFPSVVLANGDKGLTLAFAGHKPTRPIMLGLRDTE